MYRRRLSKWQGYKYTLMMPYVAAFALVAVVGFQLNTSLFAETTLDGDVTITTDKPIYAVGEVVRFTIKNDTPTTVSILNNCPGEPLEVYRNVGNSWERIRDTVEYASKCDGEPRQYDVKPNGGTASATYRYWDNLFSEAGTYRLVVPLQGVQDRPQVEFNIVGDDVR